MPLIPVPSFKDGLETTGQIAAVSRAIADDPGLIWDAITDPVVKRWAEGRYGEAFGYAGMEIATIVLTPAKRASGDLELVVEAARKSDNLPAQLNSGKLTHTELEILANAGKITPEEFVNSLNSVKSAKVPEGIDTQAASNTKGHSPEKDSATGASTTQVSDVVVNSRSTFEFNSIENPGPLSEIRGNPSANFFGGRYNAITLSEDVVLFRAGNGGGGKNAFGQWFTREIPESVSKVRIDSAVKEQWIDPTTGVLSGMSPINTAYGIKIPKGTTIYEGPVASTVILI